MVACMTSPENGQQVASDGAVTFRGASPTAGRVFELQSSATPNGPFSTIGSVAASQDPIPGLDVFGWSLDGTISTWSDIGGCQQEAFVRAKSGPYFAATFDEGSGLSCLLDEVNAGQSPYSAMVACKSDDTPVARVTREFHTTYTGDVTLSSQSEADAFACVGVIEGSLTIADNPAELHISLPSLQAVTGDVSLAYTRDPASGCCPPNVRMIDLPTLTSIGGDLQMSYQGLNGDTTILDVGLDSVTFIGGNVELSADTFNLDLAGLGAVTQLSGSVTVDSTGSDFFFIDFLSDLVALDGDLYFRTSNVAIQPWPDLEYVGGDLTVDDAALRTEPPGVAFPKLTAVGGDLSLHGTSFDNPSSNAFRALNTIGGALTLDGCENSGRLVIGDDAAGLAVHSLHLSTNDLSELLPTNIELGSNGAIVITDHPNLTACEASAFAAHQNGLGWSGSLTNTGNAGC